MVTDEVSPPLTKWELGTLTSKESANALTQKLPKALAQLENWQAQELNPPKVFELWRECADFASRTYFAPVLDQLLNSLINSKLPLNDNDKVWLNFYTGEYFYINLELEKAIDYYVTSIPIAKKSTNFLVMLRSLLALARTFYTLGEYRRAEIQAIKILSTSEEPPYSGFKAIAYFYLGQTCIKLGNHTGAEWYTLNSVKVGLNTDSPYSICLTAAEMLHRLIHKKLIAQKPESARTLFLLTQSWLRKGLQNATSQEELDFYLELFLQEGLRPLQHNNLTTGNLF
jgi:tetratricopeptide (TPR) repeat protein